MSLLWPPLSPRTIGRLSGIDTLIFNGRTDCRRLRLRASGKPLNSNTSPELFGRGRAAFNVVRILATGNHPSALIRELLPRNPPRLAARQADHAGHLFKALDVFAKPFAVEAGQRPESGLTIRIAMPSHSGIRPEKLSGLNGALNGKPHTRA